MKLIDQIEACTPAALTELLISLGLKLYSFDSESVSFSPQQLGALLDHFVYHTRDTDKAFQELKESIIQHINGDSGKNLITDQDASNTAANMLPGIDFIGRDHED